MKAMRERRFLSFSFSLGRLVWRLISCKGSLPLLLAGLILAGCDTYYEGKITDHFDGQRFFNPGRPQTGGFLRFLKWRFTREPAAWPESVPNEYADAPPARVEGDKLRLSFVGHATVLIQTQGLNILTDPIWADRAGPNRWLGARRVAPPGIAFDKLPKIDLVLISHNHYDHLNLASLKRIHDRDGALIVVPLGNEAIIRKDHPEIRVKPLDWGDSLAIGKGVRIHLARQQHWSARTWWDTNEALWGAHIIETPGGNIYFAGDAGYGAGDNFRAARKKFGPFRLAILPIGAYAPRWFMEYAHMNPEEATQAFLDLEAAHALAIHFATFQQTDEPMDEPTRRLAAARRAKGLAEESIRALLIGQTWEVPIGRKEHGR